MSAQPTAPNTAPDLVNIEIDGRALLVPKNSMIIASADKAGIPIPRFCYHDKLPIAANCRMCMVEVEMGGKPMPKPQPACATPVAEGMKIFTQSKRALSAQRNVMEFLLINHPLDCPICDQGGECELQDLAVGYGRSVSRFVERKRVVSDEDIGPLIETDMTRCIQCTRCVRFVAEIAGSYELGGMGRGEHLEIGTYIGKSIESELGGNIIDVCPVGALTNKVFRYRARAWELIARESIGYHDALGSNLWLHTRRGEVLRSVPRDNEAINECWLSDRDRYSNQGLYANDRAQRPLIRQNGSLVETDWETAINFVAAGLQRNGADLGALVAPLASCEEGWLLGKLVRGLGSDAIDHRLRVADFSDAAAGAIFEMPLAAIDKARAIWLVGSNPRHDQPMLGHRIRQAWKRGAKISAINSIDFDFNFDLAQKTIVLPNQLVAQLAALAAAAGEGAAVLPADVAGWIADVKVEQGDRDALQRLREATSSVIIFGDYAVNHTQAAKLRALAKVIARATDSAFNEIGYGANSAGLARVGAVPQQSSNDAAAILAKAPKSLLIFQAGTQDVRSPVSYHAACSDADFHVYIGSFASDDIKRTAHAVLPIGLPPEIDGTYVNCDGSVQTTVAGAQLPGDSRSGWRVLRALGAQLGLAGFDAFNIGQLRDALQSTIATKYTTSLSAAVDVDAASSAGIKPSLRATEAGAPTSALNGTTPPLGIIVAASTTTGSSTPDFSGVLTRIATVPIYRSDAVLRRCPALQAHPLTGSAAVGLNPADALGLGLANGSVAKISGGAAVTLLPVIISRAVPRGGAWIEATWFDAGALPLDGDQLTVARA